MYVYCRCETCGREKWISYGNLKGGRTKGCGPCNQPWRFRKPEGVPQWLYGRAKAERDRCTNPNHSTFAHYGGRGIEFRFESPGAAALWIVENLGLPEHPKAVELDRIDNDGHYEPGNLRWVARKVNVANRRNSISPMFHAFRKKHPEIRYADRTLRRLLCEGLTFEEIIERYHRPSDKPKGKYGTFSTADPVIASLHKDS
jgi:hypothetical protein